MSQQFLAQLAEILAQNNPIQRGVLLAEIEDLNHPGRLQAICEEYPSRSGSAEISFIMFLIDRLDVWSFPTGTDAAANRWPINEKVDLPASDYPPISFF